MGAKTVYSSLSKEPLPIAHCSALTIDIPKVALVGNVAGAVALFCISQLVVRYNIGKKRVGALEHNLTERYQLAENIKTTRFIVRLVLAHFCSTVPAQFSVIFNKNSEYFDEITAETLHAVIGISLPIFGICFVLLCVRNSKTLAKAMAGIFGNTFSKFILLGVPIGSEDVVDEEQQVDPMKAMLQAWTLAKQEKR